MIEIEIKREYDHISIKAMGHANYEEGVDRVCAAVSYLMQSYSAYMMDRLDYIKHIKRSGVTGCMEVEVSGYLKIKDDVETVTDFIESSLNKLSFEYPDNVSVVKGV